jgi:hypothetical protein
MMSEQVSEMVSYENDFASNNKQQLQRKKTTKICKQTLGIISVLGKHLDTKDLLHTPEYKGGFS